MTSNRSRRYLIFGIVAILSVGAHGLPRSDWRSKSSLAPLRFDYLGRAKTTLRSPSSADQSAKLAVAYMAQVMDQFHSRYPVYDDVSSAGNHFFAWTRTPHGNTQANVNGSFTDNPHSGATAIKCSFSLSPGEPFGGFVFLNGTLTGIDPTPQPNFGTEPNAGIDLSGATALTFWARGKLGGEVVDFFMGGVGRDPDTGAVKNPCTPSFSGPCPHPDSTRAIKITRTLTSQWQQYRIDLNGVPLNYVLGGFGWGVDGAKNFAGAEFYLDDVQYELDANRTAQRLNEPRFLKSFTTLAFQFQDPPVNDFDLVLRNSAFVYDNAVALLAFLADGSTDSLRRARLIGDAFVSASQHDRGYSDGRLRSDYSAGDISLPPGWTPNGRLGTVPVAGFYDEGQQKFIEIEQKAIDTGNNAWAMIALLALYRQTSNPSYLTTARNLGNFIHTFRNDVGTYQGFQGGLDDYPETSMVTRRSYASTEHNLDVYAAFTMMSQITEESLWQSDAIHAQQFVEAMWDSQRRCYLAGTTDPATRNQLAGQLPLDVQAWSTLAVPSTLGLHPQVLQCAEDNHRTTNNGFLGYDFNDDRDGVWFEGTGQMATAYSFAVQPGLVNTLRLELSRAQQTPPFGNNGGTAAASRDGLTTGFSFEYFVRQHVGATAWNVFAQLGYNPFYQITAPTVQFNSPSYTINEGDSNGRVNITLTRAGDTTNSASVSFATNDAAGLTNCNVFNGTASPRCDYENTIGTATWAAGDATSKSFSIAIVDDAYAEGTETFTIGLNRPSGATLGAQSTATVTITDNDATNSTNPIDNTNFFVRQQYLDFLGREPDPPGFAGWISTINNCSGDTTQCDRIHVSQLFFQSAEFQQRGYFVYRFYPVAFGRKPDYSEFVPDLASISGFLDANQLESAKVAFIDGFMGRPAFVTAYNSLNNPQYVDTLLNTAGVTSSSRQAMIDGLNNVTTTRAAVLRQIVEITEVSTKYNHQAYAVMEYFGYLRRQPDSFYLQWIQVLDSTNDPRGMVTGFVTSQEYRNRFGP